MHCPQCKTEVADGASFCPNCGAQLQLICPICSTRLQPGTAFCVQCGARLPEHVQTIPPSSHLNKSHTTSPQSAPPIQSEGYERRMVTILFADIANYSTLSESMDPENLLEIMSEAYPCMLEPVQVHGGTVIQVMGDGVLAYFGTPLAQEDDPERAITAGLEIINHIESYAQQLYKVQRLKDFSVRVGINTGLVVVGDLNPEKHLEYLALGDAVNLAARLQQIAPVNGLLISHETYRHVQGLFDVIPQPPLTVKGRRQVTQTYLVKQKRPYPQRQRRRGIEGIDTPMVGREPELAALQNHFQDAILGGETALVLIHGDAGIGKTRLSNAFVDWVALQPTTPRIMRGRSIPSTQSVPYGVLRNMFARSFQILETDSSAQALDKFRQGTFGILDLEQADLVGHLIGFNFSSSPAVQRLMGSPSFYEIANLYLINYFRRLTENPLLILLEDLQWMDDSTLDLITELILKLGHEGNTQLMILCTTRPEFFERRENWGEGITGFRQLKLRRLSRLRSRTLIADILHKVHTIPETLFECITDIAEGNPFFIEELIKMLIEQGVIETTPEEWQVSIEKLADIHVPPTLTGILQARLDSLPAAEKLAIQRAAVIGRTFWDGLLRELTFEAGEAQLINIRLSALRERGLIFQHERSSIEGHQEYLFKHALVRDAAYETVLLKHRRIYHSQVAEWIKSNSGERLEEHLALIASHYANAGHPQLAADWILRAGERAVKQSFMQEAKTLFEQALNLIEPEDYERLWRATLGHNEAIGVLGELEERHADDQALLDLAKQLGDQSCLAEAFYRIGSQAHREGDNPAARAAFDQAIQAARAAEDLTIQAEILPMQVAILTAEGEVQKAKQLVNEALEIANKIENANIIARTLTNLALYYQSIGDVTRSVDLMDQAIQINSQQGNRLGEAHCLNNLGYYYLSLGHFENGHNLLTHALQAARRLEARRIVAYGLLNLGLAEWRLGRPADACQTIDQSLTRLEALGDRFGLASRHFYLGLAYEAGGKITEAAEQFNAAQTEFEALGVLTQMIEAQAGLARLCLQQKDFTQARQLAHNLSNYLTQEGPQGLELPILVYLTCANIFKTLGDEHQLKQTLANGRKELQNRLEGIHDIHWRKIYLEAIPENRALIEFEPIDPIFFDIDAA